MRNLSAASAPWSAPCIYLYSTVKLLISQSLNQAADSNLLKPQLDEASVSQRD